MVHLEREDFRPGAAGQHVDVAEFSVKSNEVADRTDLEFLHCPTLPHVGILPGYLDRLARPHVISVEVAKMLRPGQELFSVGSEVSSLK